MHSLYLGQNIKLSLSLFISNTAIHIFWWQFYLRISCIKLAQSVHHLAVTFGLEGNNIEGRNSNERKIPSSIVTHNGLVISWNNSHQLAVYLYCSRLTGFFQGPRHMTQPKRLSFFFAGLKKWRKLKFHYNFSFLKKDVKEVALIHSTIKLENSFLQVDVSEFPKKNI